jgi:hypothetical protein
MAKKSRKKNKNSKPRTLRKMSGGNCGKSAPDCFNNPQLSQMGTNKYNKGPSDSEIAFNNRYYYGKQAGGSSLSDGIVNISKIIKNVPSNLKNTSVVISNGRFSTLGLQEVEANKLHRILKKKFSNAKKEVYSTGGFKVYFDDNKLHNKLNKELELLGGGFGFTRTSDSKSDNIFGIINSYPTKTELPGCKTVQGGKRKSKKKKQQKKKGGGKARVPMPLRFLNYYN